MIWSCDLFRKDKSQRLWYRFLCKSCCNKETREWKNKHKDYIRMSTKKYYEQHKEFYKQWHKQDRINNRQKYTDMNRERRHKKWYNSIHIKTQRLIKKLWIRPDVCPICWRETTIIAHHPDYNKWNEVVFCCNGCHNEIHAWHLECPAVINLLNI